MSGSGQDEGHDSDTGRRRRAFEVFEAVADLAGAERAQRLQAECAGDARLLAQVQALLAADASDAEPFAGDGARWSEALHEAGSAGGDDPMLGRVIGAWRITGVLGRGGMGAVYAAQRDDGAYAQRAALKLIHSGADSPAARERFLRERQTLARLQHPHVASLLDGGFSAQGDPYFVMEYVDGEPIDRWCDERRLGLRERVALFLQVLDAVQYAHANLVVHRDLKPSNLLVTAQGQVKLLDFGIARQLQAEGGLPATATSDRAMTLAYASPEQLNDAPVTTATDVYQLGVVLYRLLTGGHPFGIDADTPLARQLQQLSGDPEPLTRGARASSAEAAAQRGESPLSLARVVDGSLEAVVHACLQRDPAARYPSTGALAADLRAWLEDRPVSAVRVGRRQRARLWLRRNRLLAGSAVAIALALLGGTGAALWQAREARLQAAIAERESANARASLQFLIDTLSAADPEQAMATEVSVHQLLERATAGLERRGAVNPSIRQPLQRMLGRLYYSLGDTQRAATLLEVGLAGVEPTRREDALTLADDLVVYSDAVGALERFEQAYEAGERASALRLRFAPDDPEQRLRAMAHLSWGHVQKHGLAWCREHAERALAYSQTLADPPVDVVMDIYRDLGTAAEFEGDYPRLEQVSRQGLAFADAHGVPPDSLLRTGQVMSLLSVLVRKADYRGAEALARSTIDGHVRTGGTGGSSLSLMQQLLGEALEGQGRYGEALAVLAQARENTRRTDNGPRNTAASLVRMARVHMGRGDYAQAQALADEAMAALDAGGLPADDMFRRAIGWVHAQVLLGAGRLDEADARSADLLARARALEGEDSDWVALLTLQRVRVARVRRDPEAGMRLLAEARTRLAAAGMAPGHPRFGALLQDEAAFDRMHGDLDAAERHQRQALVLLEAVGNPVELASAQAALAQLRAGRGDPGQARRLLAQALPVLREALLPTHADLQAAEALSRRLGA